MSNKKAIVTLAIGKRFSRMVKRYCAKNWQEYADKYDYDVIFIEDPLDLSERGLSRSPAWQKCLILSQDWSKKYDRIVWIDTDILLNPNAPDVTDGVPVDKIGAVDEYFYPNKDMYFTALDRMYKYWEKLGYNPVINPTSKEYYKSFGLDCDIEHIVQTGVMVLSPKYHREIFEHVYYNYEEKGLNYEMRPLSYEILKNNLVHWLDTRFNVLLPFNKALYYPFLLNEKKTLPFYSRNKTKKLILESIFINSYFLHFTGAVKEMKLLDWKNTSFNNFIT